MKNFIIRHKKLIIIINIALLVAVIVYLLPEPAPEISTTPAPSASARPINFQIKAFYPQEGSVQMAVLTKAIGIHFTQEYDVNSLNIKITPAVGFDFSSQSTPYILYITPKTKWNLNTTYKITVNAKSKDGLELVSKNEFSFTPVPFTYSNFEE